MEEKFSETNQHEITCPSCAGNLTYKVGTKSLKCEYCGTEIEIDQKPIEIEELDFNEYLEKNKGSIETQTLHTCKCESCGANVSFEENVVSSRCPFCDSVMVVKDPVAETQIKPGAILPFKIESKEAFEQFKKWLKKLWFAPSNLSKKISNASELKGIYIPYWTYDSNTYTQYNGQRGDDYLVTESYTVVENGKPTTKTRTVTRTRWSAVSGDLNKAFDDVLVVASKSLLPKYATELEPWDLPNAVPYDEKFLSGFKTETYQVDLKDGFEIAKQRMDLQIEADIKEQIGGDHQQITQKGTEYSNISFKHILLPIYISAFRYKNKVYQFLVNARTGEVQGERPYSTAKIVSLCLFIIAVIVVICLCCRGGGESTAVYNSQAQAFLQ